MCGWESLAEIIFKEKQVFKNASIGWEGLRRTLTDEAFVNRPLLYQHRWQGRIVMWCQCHCDALVFKWAKYLYDKCSVRHRAILLRKLRLFSDRKMLSVITLRAFTAPLSILHATSFRKRKFLCHAPIPFLCLFSQETIKFGTPLFSFPARNIGNSLTHRCWWLNFWGFI